MSNIGNKETMAKNLRYYVDKSGKTQKEISDVVGVAPSTFNDWMKAKKYPRIDKIEILADYFGVLKSDLIEEQTKETLEAKENNDAMADIVIRMRTDSEFFDVMKSISKLDSEKLSSLLALLK